MGMSRRERHVRIIESWGVGSTTYCFYRDQVVNDREYSAFTDAAIEKIARLMVEGKRRQDRYNREAKARRSA